LVLSTGETIVRDMAHNLQVKKCISPSTSDNDTPLVGSIIDRLGYESLTYIIAIGAVADSDVVFTVLLEESDDSGMSGANAVADADMISQTSGTAPETAAGFRYDDDNEVRKLGYIGNKRYTRLTITPDGNTEYSFCAISAVAVLGHPASAPVTQATA
jgi:hypothetical protein